MLVVHLGIFHETTAKLQRVVWLGSPTQCLSSDGPDPESRNNKVMKEPKRMRHILCQSCFCDICLDIPLHLNFRYIGDEILHVLLVVIVAWLRCKIQKRSKRQKRRGMTGQWGRTGQGGIRGVKEGREEPGPEE